MAREREGLAGLKRAAAGPWPQAAGAGLPVRARRR
jgi:hypothetical protein